MSNTIYVPMVREGSKEMLWAEIDTDTNEVVDKDLTLYICPSQCQGVTKVYGGCRVCRGSLEELKIRMRNDG